MQYFAHSSRNGILISMSKHTDDRHEEAACNLRTDYVMKEVTSLTVNGVRFVREQDYRATWTMVAWATVGIARWSTCGPPPSPELHILAEFVDEWKGKL